MSRSRRTPAKRRAQNTQAQRLKRVVNMDIETCPSRGGALRIISRIEDAEVIEKFLNRLGAGPIVPEPTRRPSFRVPRS